MKNKILAILLSFVLVSASECGAGVGPKENEDIDTFVLAKSDMMCDIVYHRDTKVMYVVSIGRQNYGTFTVLVNPDGTPMIYKWDLDEEK